MLVVFEILSSDIRKFHYGHQIHRTNKNEHWLNCLYTRVKPALNKNLTCHLLFDIFQTFLKQSKFFREKFHSTFRNFKKNGTLLHDHGRTIIRTRSWIFLGEYSREWYAQNPKLAWIREKLEIFENFEIKFVVNHAQPW